MNGLRQDVILMGTLLMASPAIAADHVFLDGFETPVFAGTNLAGMEMNYADYTQASGPVAGTNYPVYDTRDIDYFASKGMTAVRFLFSWEAMQPHLGDPIPYADGGNYQAYFDNYKRIVDYATDVKNLRVVIEPWQADSGGGAGGARWRGQLVGVDIPASDFADFWGKMAANFKDNYLVSYGLVNEPNNMSTLTWFVDAQAAISAIRNAGSTQTIFVPGNGYTAASSWTDGTYYNYPNPPEPSNAYGWLNANGPGQPLFDPLNKIVAEVHTYLDADEGGSTTEITSVTAARDHVSVALDEAMAHGYKIYLGEIGFYAGATADDGHSAADAWADYVSYFNDNRGAFVGFTWWAGGMPGWWDDVAANGGGHFAITPTNGNTFAGDTMNMQMIEGSFPFR